jgi:RNA polymerase sigma factor (TIGR02999 family)
MIVGAEVTVLLERYRNGDAGALNELAQLVYPDLKAMARRRTRNQGDMGATALVSETFLKLLSNGSISSSDRAQFFGLAATIMRQVIVDEVRYATAVKRDGNKATFADSSAADPQSAEAETLLEINRMLDKLGNDRPQLVQVFECRYFAGYTTAETAGVLGSSSRTVERLWSDARTHISALLSESRQ